jgi:hypothetical protein
MAVWQDAKFQFSKPNIWKIVSYNELSSKFALKK